MRIGIDARLMNETGVGRYIRNLIQELSAIDKKNTYIVFLSDSSYDTFILPNARWEKRRANVRWHSLREQFVMPWLFFKNKLDLVHVPYHNIPVLYPGSFIVTIHDLIILHHATGKATKLPFPLYALKLFGYRILLQIGLRRAKHIISVSESTKKQILEYMNVDERKISVTYEAVDNDLLPAVSRKPASAEEQYALYVGNVYPHKNIMRLIEAWHEVDNLTLRIVSPDDVFSGRLRSYIIDHDLSSRIHMLGPKQSDELSLLYRDARMLVFPSLMEGFGLPGLEAMALGVPVVCSRIPVFEEIYDGACHMFDPMNPKDIARRIMEVSSDSSLRKRLIAQGKKKALQYSWKTMVQQTAMIYENSAGI